MTSWINQVTQSIAFVEGWGLYAELLIAEDTDSYEDQLWQRYGALKWRVGIIRFEYISLYSKD